MSRNNWTVSVLSLLVVASSWAAKPVTIELLLTEMVDRDAVVRFPEHDFRLKQESSYNRASQTPEDSTGWFNNKDHNTSDKDTCFIRVEENNGQKEWVLMDHVGAGTIVRTWMPFRSATSPDTDIEIRIYLDGATEPVLEGNMLGLLNGTGLIPYPLAHKSLRSAVSFFPIPYAQRCKITTTGRPFFYQFTYRAYVEGTPVKTFTMADFDAAKALTKTVGDRLLNPQLPDNESPLAVAKTLAPKQEATLELESGAPAAVRELLVKLENYDDPTVMRCVVLKMEFDGKETVWCPIGDFFGAGIGLNPFQGWYRTVAEDGTMTSRWVMPYKNAGRISIINLGDTSVDVLMEATTAPWAWTDRSMYFHAQWRGQYPVATRPYSDWNYVTLKGRGVYVGDTLTVMNPVKKWWGEGDEKIWVDGEDFPSIFGTGTEDYYAYSWGGKSTDFYQHPFHAQPLSNVYNKLNRKTNEGEPNTQGYSVETRSRSLDTMPFGRSLQLDMEIWSWSDCDMGYGVGVYWYGDEETTSNRKPEPIEVLNVPPLPDSMGGTAASAVKLNNSFAEVVECETLNVVAKSEGMKAAAQNLTNLKGTWSNSCQLLVRAKQNGDFIEIRIPASSPVAETLVLYATRSRDFGMLQFLVNGKRAGAVVDLYAGKPVPSDGIELGRFDPVDGGYVLRVEVVGKNPKSSGVFFGLDCVRLMGGE